MDLNWLTHANRASWDAYEKKRIALDTERFLIEQQAALLMEVAQLRTALLALRAEAVAQSVDDENSQIEQEIGANLAEHIAVILGIKT